MQQVRNPYLAHYYSSHLLQTSSLAPSIFALLEALNTHADISLDQVRTLCFYGIPEECKGLRALLWRLLLGYLPLSPSHWPASLHSHRHNYSLFRSNLLSPSDSQLWEVIAKDIHRTRPDLSFFFQPYDTTITPEAVQAGLKPESAFTRPYKSLFSYYYEDLDSKDVYLQLVLNNEAVEKHADVLARILYFYAKLNPGLRYIQGMNELLVPIYFAFAQDDHPEFRPYVEEDAYFCFATLMTEVKGNFVRSLDMQPEGLAGKLGVFRELLERLVPNLSLHLFSLQIEPHYYALKWITLLLSQDFDLPDTLRLWDSFLSDSHRFRFFYYVCVSLVSLNQTALLTADFSEAVWTLQHPVNFSIAELLDQSETLMKQDSAYYDKDP